MDADAKLKLKKSKERARFIDLHSHYFNGQIIITDNTLKVMQSLFTKKYLEDCVDYVFQVYTIEQIEKAFGLKLNKKSISPRKALR